MRYGYDTSLNPPAPILPIRVSAPGSEATVLLQALVDTGADCCVVPESLVEEMELPAVSQVQVRGFDGVFRLAVLYAATLEVDGTSTICEVLAFSDEALAGRDLLNHWAVVLNGPEQLLEVRSRKRKRRI